MGQEKFRVELGYDLNFEIFFYTKGRIRTRVKV